MQVGIPCPFPFLLFSSPFLYPITSLPPRFAPFLLPACMYRWVSYSLPFLLLPFLFLSFLPFLVFLSIPPSFNWVHESLFSVSFLSSPFLSLSFLSLLSLFLVSTEGSVWMSPFSTLPFLTFLTFPVPSSPFLQNFPYFSCRCGCMDWRPPFPLTSFPYFLPFLTFLSFSRASLPSSPIRPPSFSLWSSPLVSQTTEVEIHHGLLQLVRDS